MKKLRIIYIILAAILITGTIGCKKEISTDSTTPEEIATAKPTPPAPTSILQWQKCIGTSLDEFGTAVAQTSDGYFVGGYTIISSGNKDALVYKIDFNGQASPGWQFPVTIGNSGSDEINGIVTTSDGGCLAAGTSNGDVLVAKISSAGQKEWVKTFGGSGLDRGYALIKTIDGGFAIGGSTSSTDGDVTNSQVQNGISIVWLVKFNITTGLPVIEWQKTYSVPGTKDDIAYALTQGANGGYTIAGRTLSATNSAQFFVLNTDNSGQLNWTRIIGSTGADVAFGVTSSTDANNNISGYVVTGYLSSIVAVVKLNLDGSISWQKTYSAVGNRPADQGRSVLSTSLGDIIVGSNDDLFILRANDTNGDIITNNVFGGAKMDAGKSVIATSDGGFITVGNTNSINGNVSGNHGGTDIWVVKFKF